MFIKGFLVVIKITLIISLFLISTYTFADFDAEVVRIIDGDTIEVKNDHGLKFKIRLLGIDGPESNQRFGNESFLYLKKIINGKTVTIISPPHKNKPYTLGYYKRIIGKIILNGKDINLEMIKKGMAWHFKKYKKSQHIDDRYSYNKAEVEAQEKNIGLWKNENPLPPWEWRKLNKRR